MGVIEGGFGKVSLDLEKYVASEYQDDEINEGLLGSDGSLTFCALCPTSPSVLAIDAGPLTSSATSQ